MPAAGRVVAARGGDYNIAVARGARRGPAGAPVIHLNGHTDVVPVTPAHWSRDPFGGELVDGVVWGRQERDRVHDLTWGRTQVLIGDHRHH